MLFDASYIQTFQSVVDLDRCDPASFDCLIVPFELGLHTWQIKLIDLPRAALVCDIEKNWTWRRQALDWFDLVISTPATASRLRATGLSHILEFSEIQSLWIYRNQQDEANVQKAADVLWLDYGANCSDSAYLSAIRRGLSLVDYYQFRSPSGQPERLGDEFRAAKVVVVSQRRADLGAIKTLAAKTGTRLVMLEDFNEQGLCRALHEGPSVTQGVSDAANAWRELSQIIESRLPAMRVRKQRRKRISETESVRLRLLDHGWTSGDPQLVRDAAKLAAQAPNDGQRQTMLGLAIAKRAAAGSETSRSELESAAETFRAALRLDPSDRFARLFAMELATILGSKDEALELGRELLAGLEGYLGEDRGHTRWMEKYVGSLPSHADDFGVLWDRAGWDHAGDPQAESRRKKAILRWRVHTLLGSLTGEIEHYRQAVFAVPDWPAAQAAYGSALARNGDVLAALPHLEAAVEGNPLDVGAARNLYFALQDLGHRFRARAVARDTRRLASWMPGMAKEEWFADPQLVGDELTSIVIPCLNQASLTQGCIESVLRTIRTPFELLIVDNGSTDETPSVLNALRETASGNAWLRRFEVIRNESNLGAAQACNQGIEASKGQYVALLNNDTIVTESWLERLIEWAIGGEGNVGMVGPVTNAAPAPHLIEPGYVDIEGLEPFAQKRHQEMHGKALEVDRLTSFCVLIRREVIEAIGGMDLRYGLGFFEDDDFSFRAADAGFKLLVALDVYIHHFGSRTFRSLEIDPEKLLHENFQKFRERWGEERTARYRPMAPSAELPSRQTDMSKTPAARSKRPKVSLCMIVKNEEANIEACLTSVRDIVDEMVVVDTGSSDRTRELANQMGAKVIEFPWIDSFSAARNESIRHASGEWIFWLDADDRLDEANRAKLRALIDQLPAEGTVGFVCKCLCLPDFATGAATVVDHVRLFRNDPRVRWRYRVHEQILMSIREAGGEIRWADLTIHHTGYQDPARRVPKLERDIRLLLLENEEKPAEPFTLFNLGWTYTELGQSKRAIECLEQSLAVSQPSDSIVRKIYALLIQSWKRLGDFEKAMAVCREGRRTCPDDAEILFEEGVLHFEQGNLSAAEASLIQLTAGREGTYFASVDPLLRGYRSKHLLGLICARQGRNQEAEDHWKAALAERPDHLPSILEWTDLMLSLGRLDDAETLIAKASSISGSEDDAVILKARVHLARSNFDAAKTSLADVCERHPNWVYPRVIMSHVLLQEGHDLAAAESALLDVLRLAPDHASTKHNLALLQRQLKA